MAVTTASVALGLALHRGLTTLRLSPLNRIVQEKLVWVRVWVESGVEQFFLLVSSGWDDGKHLNPPAAMNLLNTWTPATAEKRQEQRIDGFPPCLVCDLLGVGEMLQGRKKVMGDGWGVGDGYDYNLGQTKMRNNPLPPYPLPPKSMMSSRATFFFFLIIEMGVGGLKISTRL